MKYVQTDNLFTLSQKVIVSHKNDFKSLSILVYC